MANEQIPELKPCPFCGGEAELIRRELPDRPLAIRWYVTCIDSLCEIKAETNMHRESELAIAAWNTRVPTTELRENQMHLAMELEAKDEQIRKLREALETMRREFGRIRNCGDPDCISCSEEIAATKLADAALKAGE